jgi:hypothetical protein
MAAFLSNPSPAWITSIRRNLRDLKATYLEDSQLADLHITIQEDDEAPIDPLAETCQKIDKFLARIVGYKNSNGHRKSYQAALDSSEKVYGGFTEIAAYLGKEYSCNNTMFYKCFPQPSYFFAKYQEGD